VCGGAAETKLSWFLGDGGRDNKKLLVKNPNTHRVVTFHKTHLDTVGIAMPQERDPFPFPRYENDDTYARTKAIEVITNKNFKL